jgi:hypothetical protein
MDQPGILPNEQCGVVGVAVLLSLFQGRRIADMLGLLAIPPGG